MKAISLFSCGGIGDLAVSHAGFDILVANELLEDRAEVFKHNHPSTQMIVGDICDKKLEILNATKNLLNGQKLDLVFATPPCQGMSKNGRGYLLNAMRKGVKSTIDPRNQLIIPTIEIFLQSGADTLVMENVPEMENTYIPNPDKDGEFIKILDFIKQSLSNAFVSSVQVIEFANYGVPQNRQRLLSIFTRNEKLKSHFKKYGSLFPNPTHSKDSVFLPKWQTLRDAISYLPKLNAGTLETSFDNSIEYHKVPLLDEEKYFWVSNTPQEKGAFDNQCINPTCKFDKNPTHSAGKDKDGINKSSTETPLYCVKCNSLLPRPWVKIGNEYRLMKGYTSAYKRMSWDSPAGTLTRNLSYACSDKKLHPEQHRTLSLHEAMILHTISDYRFDWKRADGKKVSDKLIRELIGESIPPAGLEKIFLHLTSILNGQIVEAKTEAKQFCLLDD
jgi:DNA (cytosine-5)-methyltransferase 1